MEAEDRFEGRSSFFRVGITHAEKAILPIGLLMCLSTAARLEAGDSYIDSTGDPTRALSFPEEFQQLADAIQVAKAIDPVAGAELEARTTATSGGIRVVKAWLPPSAPGVHDHDTIGVREDIFDLPEVVAVVLLHEFEHIAHCGGGPATGGTAGDSRASDPCYPCIHAAMNARSAVQLQGQFCNAGTTGVVLQRLCQEERSMREAHFQLTMECLFAVLELQEDCEVPTDEVLPCGHCAQ